MSSFQTVCDVAFCLKSDLNLFSFIKVTKNKNSKALDFTLEVFNSLPIADNTISYELASLPLCSFKKESSYDDNLCKPTLTFLHNDPPGCGHNKSLLNKMLCLDLLFPANCLCLIGCPDGKVVCVLCCWSYESGDFSSAEPVEFWCLGQPIVGVEYIRESSYFGGASFLLLIGLFGKLVFISSDPIFEKSTSKDIKDVIFHEKTLYLPAEVHKYVLFENVVLHISSKHDLWCSKLEVVKLENGKCDLKLVEKSVVMSDVKTVEVVDKNEGLLLVLSMNGVLHLCEYSTKTSSCDVKLPILINETLTQSSLLKSLNEMKVLQTKFFDAVSTFASIKFNGLKDTLSCSVTEIDIVPKRIIISVNFETLKQRIVASEFWHITANLHSCFQSVFTGISKTMPFSMGHTLSLEIDLSRITAFHTTVYPLHLEVGLTLTLPDSYKSLECFSTIVRQLPLFVRVETFVLNELSLLKCPTSDNQQENNFTSHLELSRKNFADIRKIAFGKPISNLFDLQQFHSVDFPNEFTCHLLSSSVEQITGSRTLNSTLLHQLHQLLSQKSKSDHFLHDYQLTCSSPKDTARSVVSTTNTGVLSVNINSKSFPLLVGLRIAVLELLLKQQFLCQSDERKYVSIPCTIHKQCEILSSELLELFGTDVQNKDFFPKVLSLYKRLRKRVSEMIPFL